MLRDANVFIFRRGVSLHESWSHLTESRQKRGVKHVKCVSSPAEVRLQLYQKYWRRDTINFSGMNLFSRIVKAGINKYWNQRFGHLCHQQRLILTVSLCVSCPWEKSILLLSIWFMRWILPMTFVTSLRWSKL